MHKPDVLHVLPLIGSFAQTLFEQGDRQIGPAEPGGICLGEKNRAEPIRDVEAWIEARRQVEQRIQQCEVRWAPRTLRTGGCLLRVFQLELDAAVILNRSNPVQIGGQRVVAGRQAADGCARGEIQRVGLDRRRRISLLADRLNRGSRRHQRADHHDDEHSFREAFPQHRPI